MAMDDPWGSPWADEIQTPDPVKPKGDDFAVKPTTPVKAATLALEQKTNSPWDDADDDGFGDWAAGSAEEGNGFGLDGADDGWESSTGHGLEHGSAGKGSDALSIPWNNGSITPEDGMPKLAPSLLSKSADILRQPSPDPWAVDTNREDNNADTAIAPVEQHDARSIDQKPIMGAGTETKIPADVAPLEMADRVLPGDFGDGDGISATNDTDDVVKDLNTENVEILTPSQTAEPNGYVQEAEHVSSRPSSSPSEHSHHDETIQESPRTSLDEEPKRPSIPRKVSTKIQELVEHFDGLAQREVTQPIVSTTISPERTNEDAKEDEVEEEQDEEEMDDFGDFEDVQSEIEESVEESKSDSPAKSAVVEEPIANTRETVAEQEVPRTLPSRKDLGPVEFIVDTSAFDRLYSGTETKPPSEKLFIPDTVPNDSFSSTEERKTWYRISRYGTMRKYNTGDDENYVRVNWTQSQVRADTLKIVARWIEEDRISGRVVLGGASKGSSIFGWNDSKAAPVPLAHAFAAKSGKQKATAATNEPVVEIPREWPKGLVRTRSISRTPSQSKSRRKSSTKSVVSEEAKSTAQLPVANFGWNAAPQGAQESKPQSPVHAKKTSASSFSTPSPAAKMPPARQSTSSRTASPLPIEPTKRVLPTNGMTPRPHSIAHTNISVLPFLPSNDDDDWGELVSSPSTNIPPVLPPPVGSHHRATGSLGSACPSTASIPRLSTAPTQSPKPVQNDRWSVGSNEVLKPQPTDSMTTSIPNTFSGNTFPISNNDYTSNAFSPAAQTANQPTTAASIDPWASADFSFFEISTVPVSKPVPTPTPEPIPSKSVAFNTPTLSSIPPRSQKSREEVEQDRIVQSVVNGLPDLSYMLRR